MRELHLKFFPSTLRMSTSDETLVHKNIAQAKAEERRAMAVAKEQEMRAYVVEAEAEVPKALAYALREGKLGIMDYYDMQNIKADTKMRENIAREDINAKKILEGDAHEPKDVL